MSFIMSMIHVHAYQLCTPNSESKKASIDQLQTSLIRSISQNQKLKELILLACIITFNSFEINMDMLA